MKYLKTFEENNYLDNFIYVLEQFPRVVGKLDNNNRGSNYIIGYYISNEYYHLNYRYGKTTHIIYNKEYLHSANQEEIEYYNKMDEIAVASNKYNL
jgi:hypothetical protein